MRRRQRPGGHLAAQVQEGPGKLWAPPAERRVALPLERTATSEVFCLDVRSNFVQLSLKMWCVYLKSHVA